MLIDQVFVFVHMRCDKLRLLLHVSHVMCETIIWLSDVGAYMCKQRLGVDNRIMLDIRVVFPFCVAEFCTLIYVRSCGKDFLVRGTKWLLYNSVYHINVNHSLY